MKVDLTSKLFIFLGFFVLVQSAIQELIDIERRIESEWADGPNVVRVKG